MLGSICYGFKQSLMKLSLYDITVLSLSAQTDGPRGFSSQTTADTICMREIFSEIFPHTAFTPLCSVLPIDTVFVATQ